MRGMRDGKADCCRSCLRGSLRALNYLLAIVGVLMTAYALFMYVQWSEAAPPSPVPAPHPAPPPSNFTAQADTEAFKDTLSGSIRELGQSWRTVRAPGVSEDPSHGQGNLAKYPWFIYVFGGAGAFVFITASVGILSADCAGCGVTCFLGLYHALMVLLLLIQVSVVCFYFFDKSWEEDLPEDATGEYAKVRDLVMKHIRACQIASLSTLGLQLLALLVSCSVYYAESKPRLEYRVLQQHEYDSASQASYPVAGMAAGGPMAGTRAMRGARWDSSNGASASTAAGRPEAWNRRMQEKYGPVGEEAEGFGYDPELGRAQARGDDDMGETTKKGCTIM